MKSELLKRLYTDHWASRLPGFEVRGHLLCPVSCGPVLWGFCFESSAWSKTRVQVSAFAQPLYIPSDHVVLSYGKRLLSGTGSWELDEKSPITTVDELASALASEGLRFIRGRSTPALLANVYRWEAILRRDPHARQLVAFSFARMEKRNAALRLLDKLRREEREAPEWQRAIAARSELLYAALRCGPDQANNLLTQWEAQTREALKLPQ